MSSVAPVLHVRRPEQADEDWVLDPEPPISHADPEAWRSSMHLVLVELHWQGRRIAICEARRVTLSWSSSHGDGDHDHFVALRLIERDAHPIWPELPWNSLPLGSLIYAWDHYLFERCRVDSEALPPWADLDAGWETGSLHTHF